MLGVKKKIRQWEWSFILRDKGVVKVFESAGAGGAFVQETIIV